MRSLPRANRNAPPDVPGASLTDSLLVQQEQHELQNYPQQHQQPAATTLLSQQDFLSRVSQVRDELRNLVTDVNRTSQLQQAALSGADDNAASQRRLDDSTAATQARINGIRGQLRALKDDVEATPRGASGADTKKKQWEHLNRDFQKELQAYLDEERNFRQRYRDQIARQYRIVNPDAPEEEVRRAAEMDWGNEGVFQSAVGCCLNGVALGSALSRDAETGRILTTLRPCSSETTALAKPMQCSGTCARATTSSSKSSGPSTSLSS